ncbi:hypothetical protein CTI14_13240 [Methylobacterium radiotolerans]|nr:hypothetical protein CTI14_13240 [Methylobacterium radiotolerans]
MTAPLARMFPPGDGRPHVTVANGRPYRGTAGTSSTCRSSTRRCWRPTAGSAPARTPCPARPSAGRARPSSDQLYFDTTLSLPVVWDGLAKVWRNVWTGAPA